ncbi:Cacna1h, partial [Symbiodinium microadriaticum]
MFNGELGNPREQTARMHAPKPASVLDGEDELRAANARMGPRESASSSGQRDLFQEWSSMRMHQIKDVVAWELDRLTQDLHEQVFGSKHPFSNLLGPANRHSRAPRVSELAAELAPPLFDTGVPGDPHLSAKLESNASSTDGALKPKRHSNRKQTPHAGTLLLEEVPSESNSEASPGIREKDFGPPVEPKRMQGSLRSKTSQTTEALEAVSHGSRPSEDIDIKVVSDGADDVSSGVGSPSMVKQKTKTLRPAVYKPQTRLGRLVQNQFFDIFYSLCILVNCFTMGLQADMLVNEEEYSDGIVLTVRIIEHTLVALFTFEIYARLRVYGRWYFSLTRLEGWMNFLDAVIVVLSGVLSGWILPLVFLLTGQVDFYAGEMRMLSVFRALRLLRIVRVIQQMPMFREVWLLLRGLTSSLRTLIWTVAVIFVLTYIFAILGCWLISNEIRGMRDPVAFAMLDQERQEQLEPTYRMVQGIAPLMQLLIQFLTLDSWNAKMEQIMLFTPTCLVYFYMYIAVAVFVLMNLVTAIIVENAMSASRMDEDQRLKQMEEVKRKELKELEQLFYLMDADGDGTLDWEEFENAFHDEEMSRKWRLLDFQPEECKELFDLLDDGDGGIETKEFFHGLARMKGGAQSRDLMRVAQRVDRLGKDLSNLYAVVQSSAWDNASAASDADRGSTPKGGRGRPKAGSGSEKPPRKSVKSPKVSLEEAKKELQAKRQAQLAQLQAQESSYGGSAEILEASCMGQSSLKPKVVEEDEEEDARPDSGGIEPVSPYLAVRKKEAELVRLEFLALRHLYVEEQAMWSRSGVQQMHWSFTGETTRTPCSGTTEWDSDDSDSTNSQAFQACRSMVEVQEAATPGPRPKQDHGLPRGPSRPRLPSEDPPSEQSLIEDMQFEAGQPVIQ